MCVCVIVCDKQHNIRPSTIVNYNDDYGNQYLFIIIVLAIIITIIIIKLSTIIIIIITINAAIVNVRYKIMSPFNKIIIRKYSK